MNSMNQKGIRIFSFILAIILLTLFMPTIPLVADGVDSHTDASPQEESNAMDVLPEEAVDSTGSQYVEATPVEGLEGGIIGEIPPIGDIGNEGPSVELQDYTTIKSAIVPDGVYALRNAGNTNRWMDIQQNRVDPGAYVQQYAYSQSPAELFDRAGLYKISHNTTTNTYVIRCMLNNLLTFGFDGNKVVTKYIPSDDAMVDIHDTFTITRSGDGYVIKPYGQSYTVSANNTMNSGAAGVPESYLAKRSEAEAGTRAIWLFEKYIGTQRTGVTFSSSPNIQNGLTKGITSTLTVCLWSTYINAQTPYVEMATAYEGTAVCESTSDEYQTLITGNIVGKSKAYIRIRYGSGTALTTYQADFFVTPPINEANEHYLQNVATKKYMDVEGPSTAVGAYIQQWDFSTAPQKKWVFTKQTGGYYTIQSVYSDLYVGVDSSTSTAVKQYSTVNDYTKWYFAEPVSGVYTLHNKAQGDWYVLASSSATAANGSDLTMSIYYNDSNYRDEWIVLEQKYNLTLNHYYDMGYNVRFSDESSSALTKIMEYNTALAEILLKVFGIEINATYTSFVSSADTCKILQDGAVNETTILSETVCNHSTEHDTRTAVKDSAPTGTCLASTIIWTGHVLNGNPSSVCFGGEVVLTPHHTTTIQMNPITNQYEYVNKDDATVAYQSLRSFLHEVSHEMEAHDHYCYNNGDPCTNSHCDTCKQGTDARDCIMGNLQTPIFQRPDEQLFCQDCHSVINEHLLNNH